MEQRILTISLIVVILLFILTLALLINVTVKEIQENQIDVYLPHQISSLCSSGDIFKDSKCVQAIVSSFYKYNISNVGKELSYYELREQGSTCEGWSKFFCSIGENLGYYSTILEFKTREHEKYVIYHQVCVWSNQEGYVIFDAKSLFENYFLVANIEEILR